MKITQEPMGTECLWVTQQDLAGGVAAAIAQASGLINRGSKERGDLYFLNNTEEPAILIETCFVDSKSDVDHYQDAFDALCQAIAITVSGVEQPSEPPEPADPTRPPEGIPAAVDIAIDAKGNVIITVNGVPIASCSTGLEPGTPQRDP